MTRYAELAAASDRNAWEGSARLLCDLPAARHLDLGHVRALDTRSPLGLFNPAFVFGEVRDPAGTASTLLDFYAASPGPGRIRISGRLQSGEALAEALQRAGCAERAGRLPAMLLAVEDLAEGPEPAQHGLAFVEATEAATCAAWVETLIAGFGWEAEAGAVRAAHAALPATVAAGRARAYLATLEGVPAACCQVVESDGIAGIFALGTIPAVRRRGIASALLRHVIDAAASGGTRWASLRAMPDSEPIYHRLGFVWTHDLRELLTPARSGAA